MGRRCAKAGLRLVVPPIARCTDNAAMIANVVALRLALGEADGFDLAPSTRTSLPRGAGGGLVGYALGVEVLSCDRSS